MLLLPQTRVIHPGSAPGVNWANPLTNGLVFLGVPVGRNMVDLVSGRYMTVGGAVPNQPTVDFAKSGRFNGGGMAARFLAASVQWYRHRLIPSYPGSQAAWTVGAMVASTTINTQYGVAFIANDTGDPARMGIMSGDGFTNRFGVSEQWGGGSSFGFTGTAITRVANQSYMVFARQRDLSYRDLWVDGVQDGSNTSTSSAISVTLDTVHIGVRREDSEADPFSGQIFCVPVWARSITDSEIQWATQNIWQLVAPARKAFYMSAGADGSGVLATTGTGIAALTGASIAAAAMSSTGVGSMGLTGAAVAEAVLGITGVGYLDAGGTAVTPGVLDTTGVATVAMVGDNGADYQTGAWSAAGAGAAEFVSTSIAAAAMTSTGVSYADFQAEPQVEPEEPVATTDPGPGGGVKSGYTWTEAERRRREREKHRRQMIIAAVKGIAPAVFQAMSRPGYIHINRTLH